MAYAVAWPWSMLGEGRRRVPWQPWGCRRWAVVVLLLFVMVHKHSTAKLLNRRAIVAECGFLQPSQSGKHHLLVISDLKPRLNAMEKGLEFTRSLEVATGAYRRSPMAFVRHVELVRGSALTLEGDAVRRDNVAKHNPYFSGGSGSRIEGPCLGRRGGFLQL